MSKSFALNIPISKVDEEQRIVYGVATCEAVDSQNDIVDYEASIEAFSKWGGNIREMHQPIAVGKSIDVQFDDKAREVMIGVKVSESTDGENAWIKVKEGVLTGFSIGGSIKEVKKEVAKKDGVDVPVTRVTKYELAEVSLVDTPANPEAVFSIVKSVNGGLQHVEEYQEGKEVAKSFTLPAWHYQFMLPMEKAQALYSKNSMSKGNQMSKKQDLKKGMWDAAWLLDLAIELSYYINSKAYEGEEEGSLKAALDAIKGAVVKELSEPTEELTIAVELAEKVTNLTKGKDVNKSVTGGEDRDANAEVVATAEENGRPLNDTTERAAEAGVPAATDLDEDGKPVGPIKAEDGAEAPEAKETPAAEAEDKEDKGTKSDKAGKKAEDEDEGKADEADGEEAEKAISVSDLKKFTDSMLTKLGDNNKQELSKMLGELSDKVETTIEKSVKPLEDRIKQLEDQPAAPKTQASFATIEKGKEAGDGEADVKELLKRRDELMANPRLGTSTERMDLAHKLRKAQAAGHEIA